MGKKKKGWGLGGEPGDGKRERKEKQKGEKKVRMTSREWEWVALRWEGTEVLGRKPAEGSEVDIGDYILLGFGLAFTSPWVRLLPGAGRGTCEPREREGSWLWMESGCRAPVLPGEVSACSNPQRSAGQMWERLGGEAGRAGSLD